MGLALGTNLKFYTSLSKGLKLKVKKFWALILTFVEVTGETLVEGFFGPPPSWIGLTTKAELKEEQDKIIKLQAFDPSYVRGKSYYEDDELFSISAAVWIF